MQVRDKWICVTLVLLVSLTGCTFYGFAHNDTQTVNDSQPTTIVVNGNGSSGTGDVQNVQQVTQVQSVDGGTGTTKTVYVEQQASGGSLSGQSYTPKTNGSG